jgi:hypothetical protein
VVSCVLLLSGLLIQDLAVQPFPAVVGEPVVVTMRRDGAPLAGVELVVETPDAAAVSGLRTDAAGQAQFIAERPGHHVVVAVVDGVRQVAPLPVVPARARWPLALAAVPLGLALLWRNLRGRSDQPSTRST